MTYTYRTFKSEDVSVGLWLSPVTNIIRIHDIRFDTEWTTRGCKQYHLVSHSINAVEMTDMYESLDADKRLCPIEKDIRKFYIYDWTVPPSHCCVPVK